MRTRDRLNVSFFTGSVVIAGLLGLLTGSSGVFWVALIVMLLLNLASEDIRFR